MGGTVRAAANLHPEPRLVDVGQCALRGIKPPTFPVLGEGGTYRLWNHPPRIWPIPAP